MNPEEKIGQQIKLSFPETSEHETTPVQDLVAMRDKVAVENNIKEVEHLNLKDDKWCYDNMLVDEYIKLRKQTAINNNIMRPETLRLEGEIWHVGALTLEEDNELNSNGNHPVYNKGYQ